MFHETVEEFLGAFTESHEETKETESQSADIQHRNQPVKKQHHPASLENEMDIQAAVYEQEMRALASKLEIARNEIAQHHSDISTLHEDIAAISLHSQHLAANNKALVQDNSDLRRHIAGRAVSNEAPSSTTSFTRNGTNSASDGSTRLKGKKRDHGSVKAPNQRLVTGNCDSYTQDPLGRT
ncbi:hypothetical protein TruAng_000113 [Truncatella angustata]|nr:hypothetical protein TruAng_000113 [Truncatella angustata]